MSTQTFVLRFQMLTGYSPFGWQKRLYAWLLNGDIPPLCDIPTGLGKTSVLAIWLLALADQAASADGAVRLPRRLVYIVDRRAVVDQATDDAQELLRKLQKAEGTPLQAVADTLRGLAAASADNEKPFALSTLRGQYADNREWSHDPARPAMVVGTVDLVGSRLLLSGYGLGIYGKSQHAGLLGQDTLIVLDEAQLTPAFANTLEAARRAASIGDGELSRPFDCMSLTATPPRREASTDPTPSERPLVAAAPRLSLTLEEADFEQTLVRCRVKAAKALRFVLPEAGASGKVDEAFAQRMAAEAIRLAGADSAVVVFADTVTLLEKINLAIKGLPGLDAKKQILQFTGQMRGYERDQAFASRDENSEGVVFREFQRPRPRKEKVNRTYPVFLLATSAGEVGVNFDADHAVCDLVSLERMAQRLGRVNRGGDQDGPAQVSVFLEVSPEKLVGVRQVTHRLLEGLPEYTGPQSGSSTKTFSASPEDLGDVLKHPEALDAYTPAGGPPPLDPARLDDWSLTSLHQDEFPRPQVSYWLRGITPDDDQAITQIVWREELRYARDGADASDLLETCPPLPREILQVPTYRAVPWLQARLRRHLGAPSAKAVPYPGEWAAILTPAGRWEHGGLADLQAQDKDKLKEEIVGATLVLPTTLGGLDAQGYLDLTKDTQVEDVLEKDSGSPDPAGGKVYRRALLYGSTPSGWRSFDLLPEPPPDLFPAGNSYKEVLQAAAKKFQGSGSERRFRLKSREGEPEKSAGSGDAEAETPFFRVEYFVPLRIPPTVSKVLLKQHLADARQAAADIVDRLNLPSAIGDAVVLAAAWHDFGKDRRKWQRAIGNTNPAVPLAKSDNFFYDHREAEGYRHEFGSLMDAIHEKADELPANQEQRDLVLHLIAAHHGHGRPGFEEKAYDVPKYLHRQCAEAAAEAELRFDRLQRRFGWWGLAYLEALVKCADGMASDRAANPPNPAAGRALPPDLPVQP